MCGATAAVLSRHTGYDANVTRANASTTQPHAVHVLDLIGQLSDEHGRTVVMVLHDLNLAARYAYELIAMKNGRIVAQGPPGAIRTAGRLQDLFGLAARLIEEPTCGHSLVVPSAEGRQGEAGSRPADVGAPADSTTAGDIVPVSTYPDRYQY